MTRYVLFDGELVSRAWSVVLHDMRADGVDFGINEGHRTLARQQFFWDCFQCQCCNGGNLAARPSPFAPHIRTGRADHAIDFANPEAVMRWLSRKGLRPTRPAGSGSSWEPWHIEVQLGALLRYAARHKGDKFDTLPKHVEHAARQFIAARNTVRNRIRDRDEVDSRRQPNRWKAKDRLVDDARQLRAHRRAKVEDLLKRSKKQKVRRILRELLATS